MNVRPGRELLFRASGLRIAAASCACPSWPSMDYRAILQAHHIGAAMEA
jgi:hypothetical protein